MKKNSKLTPIVAGTLLVLPSLIFLSSAQKSNAMLGSMLRGVGKVVTGGVKVANPSLSKVNLTPQSINILTKNMKTSTSPQGPSLVSQVKTGLVKQNSIKSNSSTTSKTSIISGMKINSMNLSGALAGNKNYSTSSTANKKPTLTKSNSTVSTTSTSSVDVDGGIDPNLPITERLTLTLLKNGITPANANPNSLKTSLTRLTSSDV